MDATGTVDTRTNGQLEVVRRRRADLHAAVVSLEQALAAPREGRDWLGPVGAALQQLGEGLAHHIAATERPDGLFAEVVQEQPRLAHAVARLREAHVSLSDEASRLLAVATVGPMSPGQDWLADLREDATVLIGQLARHRQAGADLIYEAYSVDVGGDSG